MRSLPDDIIVIVCQYLSLLDVFHLRLTNRRLASVVVVYRKAIAPLVARNTFPKAILLCRDALNMPVAESAWLEGLVHKYLAAVAVDRFHLPQNFLDSRLRGIPAQEEAGNAQRKRVETGWHVLSELSHISRNVYALPIRRFRHILWKERLKCVIGRNKTLSTTSKTLAILELRERMILEQRLMYLKGLDAQIVSDYRFMFTCVLSAFRRNYDLLRSEYPSTSSTRTSGTTDRFDWSEDWGSRRLEKGNSWVNWFIMHEGPALFWKQWNGGYKERNFIRKRVLQAWKCRLEQQIAIESNALCAVEAFLSTMAGSKEYSRVIPLAEFEEYNNRREYLRLNGYQISHEEIFEDVPYNIEFRGWIDKVWTT